MLTWNVIKRETETVARCLNPYSNGMLTWIDVIKNFIKAMRLNPYSNGMLTWSGNTGNLEVTSYDRLNPYSNGMLTWLVTLNLLLKLLS